MARLARVEAAGFPHHIIQRGNNRQAIFVDAADHQRYLALLQETATTYKVAIHAYVLMANHVHLLVTPERPATLSRFMQALGRRYVRWFNDRHHRTGTLWEGRFRSTVIDPNRYLVACMRYIELNPVRAGMSPTPDEYRWSSSGHHVGRRIDPLVSDHAAFWSLGNTPFERQSAYRDLLEQPIPGDLVDELRRGTNRGYALANMSSDASFTAGLLTMRRRGRPRKTGS